MMMMMRMILQRWDLVSLPCFNIGDLDCVFETAKKGE